MKYLYLIAFAALTVYTLIGLLPEAHAQSRTHCFSYEGRVVCCTTLGNFTTCN